MMNCALALGGVAIECEALMEAVKEGKKAATAANESGREGWVEGWRVEGSALRIRVANTKT